MEVWGTREKKVSLARALRGEVSDTFPSRRRTQPAAGVSDTRARGLRRVLVEGGGRTVSRFLDAEALDLLFVTTVPILLGEGVPGVRPAPAARIADAPRWPARRFMLGEDVCTEFTLR